MKTKAAIEQKTIIHLFGSLQNVIDDLDDLQHTWVYRNDIKASANTLQRKLEKHVDNIFSDEVDIDEDVRTRSIDQLIDISVMHRKLFVCLLKLDNNAIIGMQNYMKAGFAKHGVDKDFLNEVFEV